MPIFSVDMVTFPQESSKQLSSKVKITYKVLYQMTLSQELQHTKLLFKMNEFVLQWCLEYYGIVKL